MRLLRHLALAAAALYSLNTPGQSRVLPAESINSRDHGCLAVKCLDVVQRSPNHSTKHDRTSISEGLGFIFERVAPPRLISPKPKPKPDSPTVKPGQTPSIAGNPKDAPPRIGSDAAPLPLGASKPGDPGFNLYGELKDPIKLKQKGGDVDKEAYRTEEEYKADEIQKKFDDNYRVDPKEEEETLEKGADNDVEAALEDLGIAKMENAHYRSTEVFSKTGKEDAVAEAKYFPEKGIIIGESRFSERDLNPPDKKLRPSDLTFLQWNSIAGKDKVKSLRAFVGRTIISTSTVQMMQKAQRDTLQGLSEKATFKRGADTEAKRDAFELMMGTDFISSLNHMLKDHAPVLGKKQISSILCYPRTFDGKEGEKDITITVNFEDVT